MLLADAVVVSMATGPAPSRFGGGRGEVEGNGGMNGPERPTHDGPSPGARPPLAVEEDA